MEGNKSNQKNIFSKILTEFRIAGIISATNIKAAAALRGAFFLQVIGMMLNNISLLVVWIFFVDAFGEINGWGKGEVIMLDGMAALIFGIVFTLGHGSKRLPELIYNGSFDNLLLSPRNLYLRITVNNIHISAIGDVLFGIILIIVSSSMMNLSWSQVLLLLGTIPPACLVMLNMAMISSLIAFIVTDAVDVAKNAFEVFFGPSMYPGGLFQGSLRFTFLFIIPSLLVTSIPIEIVRDIDLSTLLLLWGLAVFWTILANVLLQMAVKHYESSNLVGARAV